MAVRVEVSVIVPAHNAAHQLPETLAALAGRGEVIVVDDCSRDRTGDVARAAGARVVARRGRPGKGEALSAGIERAGGALLAFVDADLGASAAGVELLLRAVTTGQADLAVARVKTRGRGGTGLVSGGARLWLRLLGAPDLSQPLSGQRALHRRALEQLLPLAPGWGVEVAMLVDAARAGLVVCEVDSGMVHTGSGRGPAGWWHRARQGWDIARTLAARTRWR